MIISGEIVRKIVKGYEMGKNYWFFFKEMLGIVQYFFFGLLGIIGVCISYKYDYL